MIPYIRSHLAVSEGDWQIIVVYAVCGPAEAGSPLRFDMRHAVKKGYHFSFVPLEEFVVVPNHVHGIVIIGTDEKTSFNAEVREDSAEGRRVII